MANPYRAQAKSTNASKFKAISGKSTSGKAFDGATEDSDKVAKSYRSTGTSGPDVPAVKSGKRLDKRERGGPIYKKTGGAVSKKGTNVTVNVVSMPKDEEPKPVPMPIPIPGGGPPPGPPEMPGPMAGAPQLGPPPGPMMRKAGGRVKMTGGADTGVGRLDKARAYKRG